MCFAFLMAIIRLEPVCIQITELYIILHIYAIDAILEVTLEKYAKVT